MGGTVIEPAKKDGSESDFDMFPSTLINGGEEANKLVVIRNIVKKMRQCTNECDDDSSNYDFYHTSTLAYF